VTVTRSVVLFLVAALAEIGGCWLIWQAVRDHRGWLFAVGGAAALTAYGLLAAAQPSAAFGRVLAAYGGVFILGSLAWAVVVDGYRPTPWDMTGALVALAGAALIAFQPR
jgi:small multidrug resistance family-3 protein